MAIPERVVFDTEPLVAHADDEPSSETVTEYLDATAAEYVLDYNPALGDSFALATAEHMEATLLVGADDDYDTVTGVSIQRFRTEPV
jgi:hypothetical protein